MANDITKDSSTKTKVPKSTTIDHNFDGTVIAAAQHGNADRMKELIEKYHADVNCQDHHGMTALHHAATIGARPCIRVLVDSGLCNYLIKDKENRYAFELAIIWAKDYAVGRLLAKKVAQQAYVQGVSAFEKSKKKKENPLKAKRNTVKRRI